MESFFKKQNNKGEPKLDPIRRYEGKRESFEPNSKGNILLKNLYIANEAKKTNVPYHGKYIPILQRDITKLSHAHEITIKEQSYRPYFEAKNNNGQIVSLQEAFQNLDEASIDNLLFNLREHRHNHLGFFHSPLQLSEYLLDISLVCAGLESSHKDIQNIVKEELRLDASYLLTFLEFFVAHPTDFYKKNEGQNTTSIINSILVFECLKKILPNVKIVDWIEDQIKEYIKENTDIKTVDTDIVYAVFNEFKQAFLKEKGSMFGPYHPSVEKEKEHSDFHMIQLFLKKQGFYEYLDNFEKNENIKEMFGFLS